MFVFAQRSGFDDLHEITDLAEVALVVDFNLFRAGDVLLVQRMELSALDSDHDRFLHLIAHHRPDQCFSIPLFHLGLRFHFSLLLALGLPDSCLVFVNDRIETGDLSPQGSFLKRVIHMSENQIETEIPVLLVQLFPFCQQLLKGQIVE
jgi:hypothetical protein